MNHSYRAKLFIAIAVFLCSPLNAFAKSDFWLYDGSGWILSCGKQVPEQICRAYVEGAFMGLRTGNFDAYTELTYPNNKATLDKNNRLVSPLSPQEKNALRAAIDSAERAELACYRDFKPTIEQMEKGWISYIKNHPEKAESPAITTLSESMRESFPCSH